MTNRIFNQILETKIRTFLSSFVDDAESIFYDRDRLIHPGEYGLYRERLVKNLLSSIVPQQYQIADGFLISGNDVVSSQCDVVIYDPAAAPILRDDTSQFFPIESVFAVGEVKSTLSKAQFVEAVRKLAEVKMIGDDLDGRQDEGNKAFSVRQPERNQIGSFLICKKLQFDPMDLHLIELYGGCLHHHHANAILSIEDGIILHQIVFDDLPIAIRNQARARGVREGAVVLYEYPVYMGQELGSSFRRVDMNDPYAHIKYFLHVVSDCCKGKSRVPFDLLEYFQGPSGAFGQSITS